MSNLQKKAQAAQFLAEFARLLSDNLTPAEAETLDTLLKDMRELEPFIEKVQKDREKTQLPDTDKSLQDIMQETGQTFGQVLLKHIQETIRQAKEKKAALPIVIPRRTESFPVMHDKANALEGILWNAEFDSDGKIMREVRTSPKGTDGTDRYMAIYYTLELEDTADVKVSKSLTQRDKRVYCAAAALWAAGNRYITPSQVYKAMGNIKQAPSKKQMEDIGDSLTKMRFTRLTVNNGREVMVNAEIFPIKFDDYLLPARREWAKICGQVVEAYELLYEPPLITQARRKGQLVELPLSLLDSKLLKTEENLLLEDYLITQIVFMKKNPRFDRKMNYSTIFEHCGITSAKQKRRAKDKIKGYLEHYKVCKDAQGDLWIYGFTLDYDVNAAGAGVTIVPTKEEAAHMIETKNAPANTPKTPTV